MIVHVTSINFNASLVIFPIKFIYARRGWITLKFIKKDRITSEENY
jgi:hypothetical protein